MRLRDVSPTLWGFLKAPAMTVNCIYVPLLTVASKAADWLSAALFLAFLVTELI